MATFTNGIKMTVSYINAYGGSSKLSIEKQIAELVESVSGKGFKAWVQEQHDLLRSNPNLLSKYCRALKFDEDILTPRKISSIIRLLAQKVAFQDIPDSEFH